MFLSIILNTSLHTLSTPRTKLTQHSEEEEHEMYEDSGISWGSTKTLRMSFKHQFTIRSTVRTEIVIMYIQEYIQTITGNKSVMI